PSCGDLPVCTLALRRLAKARLDRRPHHHRHRACAQHHCPRARVSWKIVMSLATSPSVPPTAVVHAALAAAGVPAKVSVRNLNFFYGEGRALKDINIELLTGKVTAFIGPSG